MLTIAKVFAVFPECPDGAVGRAFSYAAAFGGDRSAWLMMLCDYCFWIGGIDERDIASGRRILLPRRRRIDAGEPPGGLSPSRTRGLSVPERHSDGSFASTPTMELGLSASPPATLIGTRRHKRTNSLCISPVTRASLSPTNTFTSDRTPNSFK